MRTSFKHKLIKILSCFLFNKKKRQSFRPKIITSIKTNLKINKLIKYIFSVTNYKSTNDKLYKIIYFLGFRISIRNKSKEKFVKKDRDRKILLDNMTKLYEQNEHLQNKVENLEVIIKTVIDTKHLPKAQGYNRIVQSIDFDILMFVHEICEKYQIQYWLDFGTLLGAVRHKGFIPWDDDLDISMLYEDYLKFQEVIKEEFKNSNYSFMKAPSQIGKVLNNDFFPETEDKIINFINWSEKERLYMALDIFPYHFIREEKEDVAYEILRDARLKKILMYEKYTNLKDWENIQTFVDNINKQISTRTKCNKIFRGIETIGDDVWIFNYEDIFPLKKLEFEGFEFYVPKNYKKVLQTYYDDYMECKISRSHINFKEICTFDKQKLLTYKTIEEKKAGENNDKTKYIT